jgi:hypothetical protein
MITLIYTIDFSHNVCDEEDYFSTLSRIQNFIASSLDPYLDKSKTPAILPAYNPEIETNCDYVVTLLISDTYRLQAAMELLRAYCMLQFFVYDEKPIIKL